MFTSNKRTLNTKDNDYAWSQNNEEIATGTTYKYKAQWLRADAMKLKFLSLQFYSTTHQLFNI